MTYDRHGWSGETPRFLSELRKVREKTKCLYIYCKSKDDCMAKKATLSKKGQVTIPKWVRDELGLTTGSKISFEVIGKEAVIHPVYDKPIEELKKLKNDIRFSKKEIKKMLEDSKESWSKLN